MRLPLHQRPASPSSSPLPQEIGAYGWHYINDLTATIEEANQAYLSSTGTKHRFFMVRGGCMGTVGVRIPVRGLKGVPSPSVLPLCTAMYRSILQVQPFIRPLREWIRTRKVELGLIPDTGTGGRGGAAARVAAAGSAGKQGRSGASSRGGAPPRVTQGGAAAARQWRS